MERFGLKRHAVRQIPAELEALGAVEKSAISARWCAPSRAREVMELYALRQVLEVHAASQIPLPVPQARLAALVAVQRKHDAAVADGDARRVFRSNQRFHRELSACWTTRCWARPSRNTRAAPIPSASARWHRPAIANARARSTGP